MDDIIKQQKEFTKILDAHLGILVKISAVYYKGNRSFER